MYRQAHEHGIGALVHSNRLKHVMLLNVWAFMNEEEHLLFMSVQCHQSVDAPCCQAHAAASTRVSQLGQWKQPVQMYEMAVYIYTATVEQGLEGGTIHCTSVMRGVGWHVQSSCHDTNTPEGQ